MGEPREDQLQGTDREKLAELAGRVCYDSLGTGRSSKEYHQHILDVGHTSVLEHCNWTFRIFLDPDAIIARKALWDLINKPGIMVWEAGVNYAFDININARAAYEFRSVEDSRLGNTIYYVANHFMPQVFPDPPSEIYNIEYLNAINQECMWVSLFMEGSRGFSHEQVRHKWRTAVSQRSTRYCDETNSIWHMHPEIEERLGISSAGDWDIEKQEFGEIGKCVKQSRETYMYLVNALMNEGASRKQARGAARGFLGNALHTEMIFSASVAQWKRMIDQRYSEFADAEIRVIYGSVVEALKSSQYGEYF